MSGQRVWVVTESDYDSHRIIAVCSSLENAKAVAKATRADVDDEDGVEVDALLPILSDGRKCFLVKIVAHSGKVVTVKEETRIEYMDRLKTLMHARSLQAKHAAFIERVTYHEIGLTQSVLVGHVLAFPIMARDKDEAVKMASERRLTVLADPEYQAIETP